MTDSNMHDSSPAEHVDVQPLSIGYGRRTFPNDVKAVWGARFIYPCDLVWDRQDLASRDEASKEALIEWLNGPNMGNGAISKAQTVMRDVNQRHALGIGSPADSSEAIIYEDDKGKLVGSPQSSHGYLYVAAWLKN